MRRLIWGSARRTYHIVGNLMHWLIYIQQTWKPVSIVWKYSDQTFHLGSTLCCLLIIFANSLDPDQARQNLSRIWIQTVWHSGGSPERIFWKSLLFKKSADDKKKIAKLPSRQRAKFYQHPCNGGSREGSGGLITPHPLPCFLISYENEIIWSQWDQIITFSWDM